MELLSPINSETLDTALSAGADAVYFGLRRLNARRGAKNYSQAELPDVISKIHAASAKAHLTINIDLAQNEIALAARMLQFAEECGVDAVIVRDPAILAMRALFPKLQFHLSTQSAVASEAGVLAAKTLLHCDRVVLARELTHEEIVRCGKIGGIEIEVFIQGALCFCASGRCLLSSWVGGRSGNRGTCASPCRVAWQSASDSDACASNPLSMHDLCLLPHLNAIAEANVASLKIEGRLKSAAWIHNAVTLYRNALQHLGEADNTVPPEVDTLGNYTGRRLTDGYFAGKFAGLTDSDAGRKRTTAQISSSATTAEDSTDASPHLAITLSSDESSATLLEFSYGDKHAIVRIPPQRIANPKRATQLKEIVENALAQLPREFANCTRQVHYADDELAARLLPRRCSSLVEDELATFMRNATKEDDGIIRLALRPAIQAHLDAISKLPHCNANTRHLGDAHDTLRIRAHQLPQLTTCTLVHDGIERIVIAVNAQTSCNALSAQFDALSNKRIIISLPAVAYSEDLPSLRMIIDWAQQHRYRIEVNSWDMLYLVRETRDAEFECGAGMAVLNSASAQFLSSLGAKCVILSSEADREKLEACCANASTPLSLCIFSHPALMTTRAILPMPFAPERTSGVGIPFSDHRGTTLRACQEGALTILRPVTPYDWRKVANRKISVAHIECDLSGIEHIDTLPAPANKPFLFNYDRTLR